MFSWKEEIDYSKDPQQAPIRGFCPCCGMELYELDLEYCPNCEVYLGGEYE